MSSFFSASGSAHNATSEHASGAFTGGIFSAAAPELQYAREAVEERGAPCSIMSAANAVQKLTMRPSAGPPRHRRAFSDTWTFLSTSLTIDDIRSAPYMPQQYAGLPNAAARGGLFGPTTSSSGNRTATISENEASCSMDVDHTVGPYVQQPASSAGDPSEEPDTFVPQQYGGSTSLLPASFQLVPPPGRLMHVPSMPDFGAQGYPGYYHPRGRVTDSESEPGGTVLEHTSDGAAPSSEYRGQDTHTSCGGPLRTNSGMGHEHTSPDDGHHGGKSGAQRGSTRSMMRRSASAVKLKHEAGHGRAEHSHGHNRGSARDLRHKAGGVKKVANGRAEQELMLLDPKRVKRMIATRQDAAKSRERKAQYNADMDVKLSSLRDQKKGLHERVTKISADNQALTQYQATLGAEVQQMQYKLMTLMDRNKQLADDLYGLQQSAGQPQHLPDVGYVGIPDLLDLPDLHYTDDLGDDLGLPPLDASWSVFGTSHPRASLGMLDGGGPFKDDGVPHDFLEDLSDAHMGSIPISVSMPALHLAPMSGPQQRVGGGHSARSRRHASGSSNSLHTLAPGDGASPHLDSLTLGIPEEEEDQQAALGSSRQGDGDGSVGVPATAAVGATPFMGYGQPSQMPQHSGGGSHAATPSGMAVEADFLPSMELAPSLWASQELGIQI